MGRSFGGGVRTGARGAVTDSEGPAGAKREPAGSTPSEGPLRFMGPEGVPERVGKKPKSRSMAVSNSLISYRVAVAP